MIPAAVLPVRIFIKILIAGRKTRFQRTFQGWEIQIRALCTGTFCFARNGFLKFPTVF
jgi:hypothetical protein